MFFLVQRIGEIGKQPCALVHRGLLNYFGGGGTPRSRKQELRQQRTPSSEGGLRPDARQKRRKGCASSPMRKKFEKEECSMAVKYVFVTGGVVSGLGKGITAASLGRLLKARGYRVTMQKFDPYINIDPGTMNPIQHGEVFVTDDGAETDLDLGHYERFIDESLTKNSNVTTGKNLAVCAHKSAGDYGGGTVQVIPHITNEIKGRFHRDYSSDDTSIAIIEVGGTVGDIESQPFLEAIRQFQHEVGMKMPF